MTATTKRKPGKPAQGHGPLFNLRRQLGIESQQRLSDLTGIGLRTIQRHEADGTMPGGAAGKLLEQLAARR